MPPTIEGGQIPLNPTSEGGQIPLNPTSEGGQIPLNPTSEGGQIPLNPTSEGGHIPLNPTSEGGQIPLNPASEGGQIPLNPTSIRPTPTIHFAFFLLKPTFTLSSSVCFFCLSSFDLQPQSSQNKTILSPQHMTMPTNTVCHCKVI